MTDRGHVSMSHYNTTWCVNRFPYRKQWKSSGKDCNEQRRDKLRMKQVFVLSLWCLLIDATVPLVGWAKDGLSQLLRTSQTYRSQVQESHQTYYIHHTSQLRFFLTLKALSISGKTRSHPSTSSLKLTTLPESLSPRRKTHDSAKNRRLNHTFTSGAS